MGKSRGTISAWECLALPKANLRNDEKRMDDLLQILDF